MSYRALITALIVATILFLSASAATRPAEGWVISGSLPTAYLHGVEPDAGQERGPARFLRSREASTTGFGTLMQSFSADDFRGRRVRLSAAVRTQDLKGWAGLWMRVDDKSGRISAFDNMQSRPIKGSTGWTRHEVVLDVGSEAQSIALGVLMGDGGALWIDAVRFEVVPESVPVTATRSAPLNRPGPVNLDFQR